MSESTDSKKKKPVKPAKAAKPARAPKVNRDDLPNPVWFKPIMFSFLGLGFSWIITFYISNGLLPLGKIFPNFDLGNNNIWIGFGLAMVGFVMATRWK